MENSINKKIWRFLIDDVHIQEFETWVYETPELEKALGKEIYFELISFDYHRKEDLGFFKSLLKNWAKENYKPLCACWAWQRQDAFPISNELIPSTFYDKFKLVKKRNIPKSSLVESSWLIKQEANSTIIHISGMNLVKCTDCQDHFYVAHDPYADNILTLRLTQRELINVLEKDIWPRCFDNLLNDNAQNQKRILKSPKLTPSSDFLQTKKTYPTSLDKSVLIKFMPDNLGTIEPELKSFPKRDQKWLDKGGKPLPQYKILNDWIACRGWVCQFLEDGDDREGPDYHIIVAYLFENQLYQKYFQVGYDAYHWAVSFPEHASWFSQTFSLGHSLTLLVNPTESHDAIIFGQLEAFVFRNDVLTWCAN